jgi:hypothetical protein
MMERFITEAGLLIRDVDASATVTATNTRLDYMWQARARARPLAREGAIAGERDAHVLRAALLPPPPLQSSSLLTRRTQVGLYDLHGGLKVADERYTADIMDVLALTQQQHMILIIVLFLAAAAIVLFLFRPFQARIRAETALVANALSQLPLDVDVETMVVQAVMASKGGIDNATAEEFGLAGVKQLRRKSVDMGKSPRSTRDSLPVVPAGDYSSEHSSGGF